MSGEARCFHGRTACAFCDLQPAKAPKAPGAKKSTRAKSVAPPPRCPVCSTRAARRTIDRLGWRECDKCADKGHHAHPFPFGSGL